MNLVGNVGYNVGTWTGSNYWQALSISTVLAYICILTTTSVASYLRLFLCDYPVWKRLATTILIVFESRSGGQQIRPFSIS